MELRGIVEVSYTKCLVKMQKNNKKYMSVSNLPT